MFDFNEYTVASAYLNADEQQLEITIASSHFVIRIKSEDVRVCELSEASLRPYTVQQELRLREFPYLMLQHYLDFSILQTNYKELFDQPDQSDEFSKIAQRTKEDLVLQNFAVVSYLGFCYPLMFQSVEMKQYFCAAMGQFCG